MTLPRSARRKRRVVAPVLVAALLGTLGGRATSVAVDGPRAAARSARTDAVSIVSRGYRRTATVHVPAAADSVRVPLVIVLHGSTSSGQAIEAITGFDALADRAGFAVAYPDGLAVDDGAGHVARSWNSGGCCAPATTVGVDDVGFLSDLIDLFETSYPVDPNRVYVVGHSNGAIMAQRVGCALAVRVAAIASVSGALDAQTPCRPAVPVSMLEIHGTADPNVAYANAPKAVGAWVSFDGCTGASTAEGSGPVNMQHWRTCARGSNVELVSIAGAGHPWPGSAVPAPDGAPVTQALDATTTVWSFVSATVSAVHWAPTISSPPAQLAHGQRVPVASGFAFLDTPARIADTRGSGVLAAGEALRFVPPVPAGSTSAVVTVTVVDPAGPGYAAVYPCTAIVPNTSTVNFAAGEDQAAVTIAALDVDGGFCVATSTRIGLVVDLSGYSTATAPLRVVPTTPRRALDTRLTRTPLTAAAVRAVALPTTAPAAMLNVTVADAIHDGYVSLFPADGQGHCGTPPATSSVNFLAGRVAASRVDVSTRPSGAGATTVCAFSSTTADLVVDLEATYEPGPASWTVGAPQRIFDSRTGPGAAAGPATGFTIAVPPAAAVGLTVAAIATSTDTYVSIWPADADGVCRPVDGTSLANPPARQVRANSIVVDATHGRVCAGSASPIDLVVDLVGTA